jgi:hypothetical protein
MQDKPKSLYFSGSYFVVLKCRTIKMAYGNNTPVFNSSLGSIILIDNLFTLASENLIDRNLPAYRNTLEALFVELVYWIEKKTGKKRIDEVDLLKKVRAESSDLELHKLKDYHMLLNKWANECGLRLKSTSDMAGVMLE